ncbi:hypothetical protein GQ600_27232 [Phytophthora cactorum]|nr:hypothetical protein GQ600_27232 [Phytophthora cactorum]
MEVGQTVQFDEDAKTKESRVEKRKAEDAELGDVETTAELLSEVVELTLQAMKTMKKNTALHTGTARPYSESDEERHSPSANKVWLNSARDEMRTRSEWMMMFAPVAMPSEVTGAGTRIDSTVRAANINQLVEETVLLLSWEKKLKVAFGLAKDSGGARSAYGCSAKFKLGEDPSKIPLPKTPETKSARYSALLKTPMEARSVKRTPSRNASKSSRYSYMYDAVDEAELGGGNGKMKNPATGVTRTTQ